MANLCGECVLIEYGSGTGIKTGLLIDALKSPRMYVPVDIAADFLAQTAERIRGRFPDLGRVRSSPTSPPISTFPLTTPPIRALHFFLGRRSAISADPKPTPCSPDA